MPVRSTLTAALTLATLLAGCASLLGAEFDRAGPGDLGASGIDASPNADGEPAADGGASVPPPIAPDDAGHCPTDRKLCGGACVSLEDPGHGCAYPSCDPCSIPHGTAA